MSNFNRDEIIMNTETKLDIISAWCKKHKKSLNDFLVLDAKLNILEYIDIACFEYNDRPMFENIRDLDDYIKIKSKDV